jgi:hypothetical protein
MNHIWILLPSLRTILWCIALASPIVLPCVLYRFVLILLNVSYRKVLIRLNFSWSSFILFYFILFYFILFYFILFYFCFSLVRSFVFSLNHNEKGKNAIYCNAITWEQCLAGLLSPLKFRFLCSFPISFCDHFNSTGSIQCIMRSVLNLKRITSFSVSSFKLI